MVDENIVIRFTVESDQALKNAASFREEIDKSKAEIKRLAEQANVSYAEMADAIKKANATSRMSKADSPLLSNKKREAEMSKARADIREYNKMVSKALEELIADENRAAAAAQANATAQTQANQATANSAQAAAQANQSMAQSEVQAMRNRMQSAKLRKSEADAAKAASMAEIQAAKASNAASLEQARVAAMVAEAEKLRAEATKNSALAQESLSRAQLNASKMSAEQIKAAKEQAKISQEQAKAAKEQARADAERAKAQQEQAKAQFAQSNEAAKNLKLRAEAFAAASAAGIAPQVNMAKAQQANAQAATANANAQAAAARATTAQANASVAGGIANANLAKAQSNAAASAARATKAQQALTQAVHTSSNAMKGFGKVVQFAFGTFLGMSLQGFLSNMVTQFQTLIQSGVEYANSLYRLGASVRALQRTGMDITIADTVEQVDKLRESYRFLSRREAVEGVAAIQTLTRSFDFTKEQMKSTAEAAVVLSTVTGKDYNEVARELALFLSSGYAESLQRAGLAVNRLTVAQKAQQLGIEKGYNALTEQERAYAGLELVLEEIGPLMDEIKNYEKSLAGQIDVTNAKIQDMTDTLILQAASLKMLETQIKLILVNVLNNAALAFFQLEGIVVAGLADLYATVVSAFEAIEAASNGVPMSAEKARQRYKQIQEQFIKDNYKFGQEMVNALSAGKDMTPEMYRQLGLDLAEGLRGGLKDGLEEDEDYADALEKGTKELFEMIDDLNKDLQDAQSELLDDMGAFDPGMLDSIVNTWDQFFASNQNLTVDQLNQQKDDWERFFGDFGNITDDGLDKAWEIWRTYYSKLEDIARDTQQNIEDENREYAQNLEDLELETQQKLEDAARKYREEEIKAERDYQEKLKRLREEYLFDLEDALRERDALQVIRLMRRYQLDKQQLEREHENEAQDRADAYRQEIEDIRRQAARKAEELRIEHQRRLEEIQLQAERERQEAEIQRQQAMDELKEDLEKEREERKLKYEQELEDLRQRFKDELTEILKGLQDQYDLSESELNKISGLFSSILGQNGPIAGAYSEFAGIMGNMVATLQQSTQEAINYVNQLNQLAMQAQAAIATVNAATAAGGISPSLAPNGPINSMPPNPWSGVQGGFGTNPVAGAQGSMGSIPVAVPLIKSSPRHVLTSCLMAGTWLVVVIDNRTSLELNERACNAVLIIPAILSASIDESFSEKI